MVIDDHDLFRDGLRLVLESSIAGISVMDSSNLIGALSSPFENIQLILLDYRLGQLNGLNGIDALKRKWPHANVIVLSAHDDPATVTSVMNHGADGFISKAENRSNIISTIKSKLATHTSKNNVGFNGAPKTPQLTQRQQEVLSLLQRGYSNKVIAQMLSVSVNTVRRHVQDILVAYNVTSRAEAVFHSQHRQNSEKLN